MQNLVIVESPTKARTLMRFLGAKYQIEASMGHVRDLPKADLGVDVENNFEPNYIIPRDKKKRVNELKKIASKAKNIWLATDPDREGEAIAWHIEQLVSGSGHKLSRVVFHEITEEAIKEAFLSPRSIDLKLVDAQQARRVLDRLVGYKLSPLLWKKVKRGLSAGRVQTVALRLIVEREREIRAFVPVEYWSIEAEFEPEPSKAFTANLIELNGEKLEIKNQEEADGHVARLQKEDYRISKVTQKEVRRFPSPPFTTSTLQQTAGNKLGMSAKRTMMVAQNLYEHGLITYMRTDSVNLAAQAVNATRQYVETSFGKSYLPDAPRVYKSKSKNAQEAHEAIRPTNVKLAPEKISGEGFTKDHRRLYELIWKRMVACQMNEAVFDHTTVDISADAYLFRATGSTVKFDGWLKLYGISQEDDEGGEGKPFDYAQGKQILPKMKEDQGLDLIKLLPEQHFTEPPPRYTEASLIKKMEELGIGRPSTYAPTLSTIQERFYVERQERKFTPTVLGETSADFLIKFFPDIFDYEFTALMEDQLDDVSRGEREWRKLIKDFYVPLEKKLENVEETAAKVEIKLEVTDEICPLCHKNLVVRIGRFGKFLACSGFPECKHTQNLGGSINAKCPKDNGEIVVRRTKKGKTFYGCKNWPDCKFASWTKPK